MTRRFMTAASAVTIATLGVLTALWLWAPPVPGAASRLSRLSAPPSQVSPELPASRFVRAHDAERLLSSNRKLLERARVDLAALKSGDSRAAKLRDKIRLLQSEILALENASESLAASRRNSAERSARPGSVRAETAPPAAAPPPLPAQPSAAAERAQAGRLAAEWREMSAAEKERYAFLVMGSLEKEGVFVMNPPYFYIEIMDGLVQQDPFFDKEYLDNLFIFNIYDQEPQTRAAIDRLREKLGLLPAS